MANTGVARTDTVEKVLNGVDTGQILPNNPSDSWYIPPTINPTLCPVTYTTECPTPVITGRTGAFRYQFSLPNSSVMNPSVTSVRTRLTLAGSDVDTEIFTLPNVTPNFFDGTLAYISNGSYVFNLDYLDGSSSVIQTCNLGTYSLTI